ncbi:MAG: molybdopterin-dependent oxidoreductase [Candidatus Nanopelagicales bacterium]
MPPATTADVSAAPLETRTASRTCPLCEATCGVDLTIEDGVVTSVRGDDADVFSRGHICPKGVALGELHHDPARVRQPLVRDEDGVLRPVTWEQAYAVVRERLRAVVAEHGPHAVAVYLGNPNVHNLANTFYVPALVRALGTRYRFSASTVDQMPKQVACGLLFGTELSVPVPDLDRTSFLLVLGANPLVSQGSLLTAPDVAGRLRALRRRGGRLVVVDPVRTRTAAAADEHLPIRPGSDAFLLASLAQVLVAEDLVAPGAAGEWLADGALSAVAAAVAPFTPEATAPLTGIDPDTVRRLARDLAPAESAAVYGRMGTTTSGLADPDGAVESYGTAASWLVDVLHVLTGNLDRPGGALWPLPAAGGPNTGGEPGRGRGIRIPGSQRTRVRGLPSALGEFPASALAEEIDTPDPETGERLRALVVVGGNPVVSTPESARLDAALDTLDLVVCVDAYVTETSRHAHVLLPAPSPLARPHFDLGFAHFAVRNVARYSPPSVPLGEDERDEGDTLLTLAAIAAGAASGGDEPTPDQVDDLVAYDVARRAGTSPASRAHGRDPGELLGAVGGRRRAERILDLSLRAGPYGDGFGSHPGGLSLEALEQAPHGVDLGPLQPRLPEVLRTPSGRIELAAPQLVAEAERMAARLAAGAGPADGLLLVGRRQTRSCNSWMHNLPLLAGGSNACTLQVHPADADRLGLVAGADVTVTSAVGSVVVPVDVTDAVAPGVVCLPHGWGHDDPATWGEVARARPGVASNRLTDSAPVDPLAATAVLNGITVQVAPV